MSRRRDWNWWRLVTVPGYIGIGACVREWGLSWLQWGVLLVCLMYVDIASAVVEMQIKRGDK